MNIKELVELQREYFLSGATLDINERIENIKKIKNLLIKYSDEFLDAFKKDFNKNQFDAISTEMLLVLNECDFMIKHAKSYLKSKRVKTSIINFKSYGRLIREPYGVTLVMAPWNYPLQLALEPVIGSIACGNTVIIKPASYTKNVSNVIKKMFDEFNNEKLISVVLGGRNENTELLEQKFDYIFFTGSTTVGKVVLEHAAKNVTPVTLELGGKSPCIVDEDADIDLAAKRIVWGKFLNAGQTCVAPDYILINAAVHEDFIKKVKFYINKYYYKDGQISDDFPYLINEKHKEKVLSFIDPKKVIFGGKLIKDLLLEPTVMDNVTYSDAIMQEEIFGPIMPIIEFNDINKEIIRLKNIDKPLALYYFGKNNKTWKRIQEEVSFGGGCHNDVVMHLTNDNLPFGGVGNSGMGQYHGTASLDTFSHKKSIFEKSKFEVDLKYPPLNQKKIKLLRKITKL